MDIQDLKARSEAGKVIPKEHESEICGDCQYLRDYCGLSNSPTACPTHDKILARRQRVVMWRNGQNLFAGIIIMAISAPFFFGFTWAYGTRAIEDVDNWHRFGAHPWVGVICLAAGFLIILPDKGYRVLGALFWDPYKRVFGDLFRRIRRGKAE